MPLPGSASVMGQALGFYIYINVLEEHSLILRINGTDFKKRFLGYSRMKIFRKWQKKVFPNTNLQY